MIYNSFDSVDTKPQLIEQPTYQKLIEIQTQNLSWDKKIINNIKNFSIENMWIIILFIIMFIFLILRYFYIKNKKEKYDIIYGKKNS